MESENAFNPDSKEEIKNILLEGPELISPEEEKEQDGETSFSLALDSRRYYLGHKNGKPFFMVEYFDSLPDELSEEEKKVFTKEIRRQGEVEKVVYTIKNGEVPEPKEEMQELDSSQSKEYRIALARDFEKGNFFANDLNKQVISEILIRRSKLKPDEIPEVVEQVFKASLRQDYEAVSTIVSRFPKETIEEIRNEIREKVLPTSQDIKVARLIEILKNKRVLFYTGAGISIASGVPDMAQLEKNLGIEMSEKIDGFLENAISDPKGVINSWEEFTKRAFQKPATPAHQSLSALAQKLKAKIFTENVDNLQERAGVKAIHLTGPWLKENIKPEWLKDIDAVITIGLSYDDRGFLGWYKENNPNGKIIAVNLNQPSYLGKEDFLLKEDCQEAIPELEKNFSAEKQNL